MIKTISALVICTMLASCATLTGSTKHKVHINSNIEGAKITIEGVGTYTTPAVVKLRGRPSYVITVKKECYKTNTVTIHGKQRAIAGGGFEVIHPITMFIDHIGGAAYTLPRKVFIKLELEEDFHSDECRQNLKKSF